MLFFLQYNRIFVILALSHKLFSSALFHGTRLRSPVIRSHSSKYSMSFNKNNVSKFFLDLLYLLDLVYITGKLLPFRILSLNVSKRLNHAFINGFMNITLPVTPIIWFNSRFVLIFPQFSIVWYTTLCFVVGYTLTYPMSIESLQIISIAPCYS